MIAPPQADERHRLATMASPSGLFLMDADGEVVFANPRACAILGASERDLLGSGFLAYLHPDDRARAIERVAERLLQGDENGNDYRLARPDGEEAWIRVWSSPTRSPAGEVTGLAGAIEDITKLRAQEQAARALEQRLERTQRLESLGLLAGGIAHDFNNMLMGIVGNATIAQMDVPEGSEAAQALSDLVLAAERATELTAQLLAYAGRGRRAEGAADIGGVVEESLTLLRTTLPSRAQVKLSLDLHAPPVAGDATRLRQVVMNLISNAVDALGEGGGEIAVRTSVESVDAARKAALHVDGGLPTGEHVVLEIRDTGCGMSAATLARIFDPFFTTKKKGRGLGLAATIGTIRAHEAGLEVETAPGAGTAFRVILKSTDRPVPTAPRPQRVSIDGSGAILVVDDDSAVRDVTRRLLSRNGFEVLEAADGEAGIARLAEAAGRVRCVLLDLTMPGIEANETVRRMRTVDPTVPVVVMSGHSERMVASQCAGVRVSGILHKPFDLSALLEATKAALVPCRPEPMLQS